MEVIDCVSTVQDSFVMRHQNAVVYVALFLAVLMLTSSLGLIFSQHINIKHVSTLFVCFCVSFFLCLFIYFAVSHFWYRVCQKISAYFEVLYTRAGNTPTVMMLMAVSKRGKMSLMFVDAGAEVNST